MTQGHWDRTLLHKTFKLKWKEWGEARFNRKI